jgi:purine nucleosidase
MTFATSERGLSRRSLLSGGVVLSASVLAGCAPRIPLGLPVQDPAIRVIVDNDFGGDPDGLFMLAHFMLSPSIDLPLVIGSQYRDFGVADLVPDKGQASVRKARELLGHFPQADHPPLVAGRNGPLPAGAGARHSLASEAIIREAMREDRSTPLFYAAGGSLTELALALMAEPAISQRMTLVWIGGAEHPDAGNPPPGPAEPEYNFSLDPLAAQFVFNEAEIPIWQIPRNAFRQMLVGLAEIDELARFHPVGRYLRDEVVQTEERLAQNLPAHIFTAGETYMLGDTALVTLTALRSAFQADAASSVYLSRPTPTLAADGSYVSNPAGRPMRVYTTIDGHLTWRDFTAKLRRR